MPLQGPDVQNIDSVRLRVLVTGFARFSAILGRGTAWQTYSSFAVLAQETEAVTIDLPFTSDKAHAHPLDTIGLMVQGASAPLEIVHAELVTLADSARLPAPGTEEPVGIGSESRPAWGLMPGASLVTKLPPIRNGRIEVGAAIPPVLPLTGDAAITLSLIQSSEVVAEETFPLDRGWTTCALDATALPRAVRRSSELELRISTSYGPGVICSVPRWLAAPRDDARAVLLVTSDTHRADHVGYARGQARAITPTIDALAARGLTFHHARSASSITNPSHASILTGKPPRDTGIYGNLSRLPDQADTLAEAFESAGFRTFAATSARHLTPSWSGFGQGFERFIAPPFSLYEDGSSAVDSALAMLKTAEGQDVFLWVHFFDAHGPYRHHEASTGLYYDREKSDPFSEAFAKLPAQQRLPWEAKLRDARYALALYSGEVTYVDTLLGRLFAGAPRLTQGWIALTADHGESLGEQNVWWSHESLYPATLRVPLVLAGPGVPVGDTSHAVSNMSLAATLLGLSGVDADLPGERLDRTAVESPGESDRIEDAAQAGDAVHWALGSGARSAGMFAGSWYYLLRLQGERHGNPLKTARHNAELYDLKLDPDCQVNVLTQHPQRAARMRQRMIAYLNSGDAHGLQPSFAESPSSSGSARGEMRALGYAAEAPTADTSLIDPNCPCSYCAEGRAQLNR